MKLMFYMLRRFFATFLGALIFFVLILSLTDLFINIWDYISKNVSSRYVGLIMLYYIPKTVWYSVPMAMLFATAYMLSDLYAKNELLAVFASGISLFRFVLPLMVLSVFVSVGLFVFEDKLVVQTYSRKMEMQEAVIQPKQKKNERSIVVMSEGGRIIYKARDFDSNMNRLYAVTVLFRNDDAFDALISAETASWTDDHWELRRAYLYKKSASGYMVQEVDQDHLSRLREPPDMFRTKELSVEGATVAEARSYIAQLERAGLPSAKPRADYYKKYAFPFVVVVVVLLAIGLSGKTRKNVLLISLSLSLAAVVVFYIMQMVTMLMAQFGAIPPVCGEWVPVLFFVFLSFILLRYART